MRTAAPFVVHRLWLDLPVNADRAAFLGTGGRPPLDNISVLERYEGQAADWARRTGGSVVELHAYAVADRHDDLHDRLIARMQELYPETERARIVGERVLCRNDCPRFAPGDFAGRPGVDTPHVGLALAGDGIRIDLPVALMERAATTGWTAANRLLSGFGIRGHALETVPTQGRSVFLRRLANRARQLRR
jgi:isorenieratene synthase